MPAADANATGALTLIIDTSLNACTAALCDGDRVVAERIEPMARGHQERLGVMIAELFETAGVTPRHLGRIGVTLGPGSFTGLRVGLSFAKGLAVGLGLTPKGIGTLEALGHHPDLLRDKRLVVIDGGRGQIYAQAFTPDGQGAPFQLDDPTPYADFIITGPGAHLVAGREVFAQSWPSVAALNACANAPGHDDLTPLYMRDADAKVSTRGIIAPLTGSVSA